MWLRRQPGPPHSTARGRTLPHRADAQVARNAPEILARTSFQVQASVTYCWENTQQVERSSLYIKIIVCVCVCVYDNSLYGRISD